MAKTKQIEKIEGTEEAWEEGKLGNDAASARPSSVPERAIDEALGLQMISIRLPKRMIDDLKAIAKMHGMGYQPLIREQLTRFVDCEMKNFARQFIDATLEAEAQQEAPHQENGPKKSRA